MSLSATAPTVSRAVTIWSAGPLRRALVLVLILTGITLSVTAGSASAAQGGWDRNHYWIKVTRGDVAKYGAGGACALAFSRAGAPQAASWACPPLGWIIGQVAGHGGVWAEAYPGGYRWSLVPGYRVPRLKYVPPSFRYGFW